MVLSFFKFLVTWQKKNKPLIPLTVAIGDRHIYCILRCSSENRFQECTCIERGSHEALDSYLILGRLSTSSSSPPTSTSGTSSSTPPKRKEFLTSTM